VAAIGWNIYYFFFLHWFLVLIFVF
jgi:hypothetical protein